MAKPRPVRVEDAVKALYVLRQECCSLETPDDLKVCDVRNHLTEISGRLCNIALALIGYPDEYREDDDVAERFHATREETEACKYPEMSGLAEVYTQFFFDDGGPEEFLRLCLKGIRDYAEEQIAKEDKT